MIFLEYVGSRVSLSAEIKTSPVKSMFYGTFSIYPGQPKDIQTGIYRTGNAEVIKIL